MSRADATSVALRNIVALCSRGEGLRKARLYGRSADKFKEAATELEALDSEPDNLVAVALRAKHVGNLIAVAYETDFEPTGARAAPCQAALLELPRAIAALRRREEARTLLRRRCRKLEEAWAGAMEVENFRRDGMAVPSQYQVDVMSSVVGYYCYMTVAQAACCYFLNVVYREELDEDEMALTCDLMSFVARALDYIHGGVMVRDEVITAEADVVRMVMKALEQDRVLPLDTDGGRKLRSAWRRLQRSGEPTRRLSGLLSAVTETTSKPDPLPISVATPLCELPACNAPELRASAFKKCGACKAVVYCCKEHQVDDWPRHKAACKAARADAAAAGAPSA